MIFSDHQNHQNILRPHYQSLKADVSSWCYTGFEVCEQKRLLLARNRTKRHKMSIKLQLDKLKRYSKGIPQRINKTVNNSYKSFPEEVKTQISPKIYFTYVSSISYYRQDSVKNIFRYQQSNLIQNHKTGDRQQRKGNFQKYQQQQKLIYKPSQSTINYTNVELVNGIRSNPLSSHELQVNPSQTLSITSKNYNKICKIQPHQSQAIQNISIKKDDDKEIGTQQTLISKKFETSALFGKQSENKIKKFQRGTLFKAVRRSQTLKNDYQSSSSQQSQVIEDYKSLMSKIQQHRLQDSQEFGEI